MNLYETAPATHSRMADSARDHISNVDNASEHKINGSTRVIFQPFHRIVVVSIVLTYALLLIAVLAYTISVLFAYENYGFHPITKQSHFIWTWGIIILSALGLPIRINKPSAFFVWLIYLAVFVPAVLIPPYALGYGTDYAPYQGFLLLGLYCVIGVGALPLMRFSVPRWSFRVFVIGLLIYSACMMIWLVTQVGVPTRIPTFSNVYAQRTAFGTAIAGAGPIFYLISWQTSVVNPLILLSGLYTRRWGLALTGIGLNLLMYSLAGHKSHLLSSVLVVVVYLLLKLKDSARGILVAVGAILLILVSQALWVFDGSIYPISVFVRRLFMVPGMLSGYYFDYFSDVGQTYRFGPLDLLFEGVQLERGTPQTIAFEYFRSETGGANANFWADAFSAVGYPGIVLASLLLMLVLWVMDSLSISRPASIAIPMFVVALYSLTNSALPTSLLTHGILVAVFAVWTMPLGPETAGSGDDTGVPNEPISVSDTRKMAP